MTVENLTQETEEEEKQSNQPNKLSIIPFKKRKYDVYDKRVYLNKRESHVIAFGYLRNRQYELTINLPSDLLSLMFKFYYNDSIKELLRPLPLIKELIQQPQITLFTEKLTLAETTLDFTIDNMEDKYETAKNTKTKLLNEIIEFIAADSSNTFLSNTNYNITLPILINMISKNLFRSLPHYISPYINSLAYINDDEKDISDLEYNDPSWPHLELIYDILWRLINTPEFTSDMMEKYLNKSFLENLVQLFNSRQQKERQYLMMILHKIYGRSMKLRPIILDIISSYLYDKIIYSKYQSHYGINELLEIISVIISGLKTPIKQRWNIFFQKVLIQMYKSYALKMFYESLTRCCIIYIAKDIKSTNYLLNSLLNYWPNISPQKEEIFIYVISNIINALITNNNFEYKMHENILIKIVKKLAECLLSNRQTILDGACDLWQEKHMQNLIDLDRNSLLYIIVCIIHKNKQMFNENIKLKQITEIYKSLDIKYWKNMTKYLKEQDKKEKRSIKYINEFENNNNGEKDVWINIKQKMDKRYEKKHNIGQTKELQNKQKKWINDRLTNAEKMAKRKYYWKLIHKIAATNESKFNIIS